MKPVTAAIALVLSVGLTVPTAGSANAAPPQAAMPLPWQLDYAAAVSKAQAQHQLRQQQMHALQQQSAAYEVQQRQLMHGQQPQQHNPLQQLQQQQPPPPHQPQQQPLQRLPAVALPLGNAFNGLPSPPPIGNLPGFAPQPAASRPTGESQQLIEQTNHLKSLLGL